MTKLLIKLIYGDNFSVFINSYLDCILIDIHQKLIENYIFNDLDEAREYLETPEIGQLITLYDGTQLMYNTDHSWYVLNMYQEKTNRKYPHKCSNNCIEEDIDKKIISCYRYY